MTDNKASIHPGQFVAKVAANAKVCDEHYRLLLRLPEFPASRPGQFIQIACRGLSGERFADRELDWLPGEMPRLTGLELAGPLAMLRRPFSLAGRREIASGVELEIIQRVVGVGTDWLSKLSAGDAVQVIGPVGIGFEPPPTGGLAVLVGGGVGIPPMLYLANWLSGVNAVAFCGATSRRLLALSIRPDMPPGDPAIPSMCIDEFTRCGVPAVISTDDGSCGFRGLVTQALERYLHGLPADMRGLSVVYTCGPEPMMKRVAEIAASEGIQCQVAVERAMACGMGTCQSCVIKVKKPDPAKPPLAGRDWCYRLACTDGPVFKGTDLLW
ncbi:MAG: hypothetical protein ABSH20_20345 [Tepidisphaeraceae bacterium]|jgi:dihydroorotate dehydrogenase electron transfer subunit